MTISKSVNSWASELRNKMNTIPERKMHHDKPMYGPIRDKKEGVAKKMKPLSQAEALKQRHAKFEKKIDTNSKGYTQRMNTHTLTSHEAMDYQKRIGRAYND